MCEHAAPRGTAGLAVAFVSGPGGTVSVMLNTRIPMLLNIAAAGDDPLHGPAEALERTSI
jgi:hypothetical protein